MSTPPTNSTSLQIALSLDDPSGPQVAAWRDHYNELDDRHRPLVDMCVQHLHERRLCYACGTPADRLVLGEFPWACRECEPDA